MRTFMARLPRFMLAIVVFSILAVPALRVRLVLVREQYRLAEAVGIMHPSGSLGGQVAGFNYQRYPQWVHPTAWTIADGLAFAPGLIAAFMVFTPGSFLARATLCGGCGRTLKNLERPACPHCGKELA